MYIFFISYRSGDYDDSLCSLLMDDPKIEIEFRNRSVIFFLKKLLFGIVNRENYVVSKYIIFGLFINFYGHFVYLKLENKQRFGWYSYLLQGFFL